MKKCSICKSHPKTFSPENNDTFNLGKRVDGEKKDEYTSVGYDDAMDYASEVDSEERRGSR